MFFFPLIQKTTKHIYFTFEFLEELSLVFSLSFLIQLIDSFISDPLIQYHGGGEWTLR